MLLSIIIPTKNRKVSLNRLLGSIFKQTIKNYEIIIVDQSDKRINDFKKIKKIKYFHEPNINSLTDAKNFGIKYSVGEYIGFFDDDLLLNKNFLSEIVDIIREKNPLGVSGVDNLSKERNILHFILKKIFLIGLFKDARSYYFDKPNIIKSSKLSGGYTFFRKDIFKKINFRNKGIFHLNEDVDFSLKIKKKIIGEFYINKKAFAYHFTRNTKTMLIKDFEIVSKKFKENIKSSILVYKYHGKGLIDLLIIFWLMIGFFCIAIFLSIKFRNINPLKVYFDNLKLNI